MRKETPAERSLRLLLEDPDLLDFCASNLYEERGEAGPWGDLTEEEKKIWREAAIAAQKEWVALPEVIRADYNNQALKETVIQNTKIVNSKLQSITINLQALMETEEQWERDHHLNEIERKLEEK